MKQVIKIMIYNVCITLLILHPKCVNQKSSEAACSMYPVVVSPCKEASANTAFNDARFSAKSKNKVFISAELIVLKKHARPKKKRPAYLYC